MMFLEKPEGYLEDLKVGACIIEAEGEILLLEQGAYKDNAGVWLEPGGKLDAGENYESAMLREVLEETGIDIRNQKYKKLFRRYMYYQGLYITLEMYYVKYNIKPKIDISNEHSKYIWVSPLQSLEMNLVEDLDEILIELYDL